MAKSISIRKKALDFARTRQWDKALAEFNKLIEIEQHNPNLFNEIVAVRNGTVETIWPVAARGALQ